MRHNTQFNRTLTGGMALTLALTMALAAAPTRARADAPNFPSNGLGMNYSDNLGTTGNSGSIQLLTQATDPKTGATLVEVLLVTFPPKGPEIFYVGSGIVQTFSATPSGQRNRRITAGRGPWRCPTIVESGVRRGEVLHRRAALGRAASAP